MQGQVQRYGTVKRAGTHPLALGNVRSPALPVLLLALILVEALLLDRLPLVKLEAVGLLDARSRERMARSLDAAEARHARRARLLRAAVRGLVRAAAVRELARVRVRRHRRVAVAQHRALHRLGVGEVGRKRRADVLVSLLRVAGRRLRLGRGTARGMVARLNITRGRPLCGLRATLRGAVIRIVGIDKVVGLAVALDAALVALVIASTAAALDGAAATQRTLCGAGGDRWGDARRGHVVRDRSGRGIEVWRASLAWNRRLLERNLTCRLRRVRRVGGRDVERERGCVGIAHPARREGRGRSGVGEGNGRRLVGARRHAEESEQRDERERDEDQGKADPIENRGGGSPDTCGHKTTGSERSRKLSCEQFVRSKDADKREHAREREQEEQLAVTATGDRRDPSMEPPSRPE